mmetsp:Transcript_16759/g.38921  ORF Transcript_16759/g.38921 Transcript_16759/m.38921 type:complete len:378 (-) Transcript_16759:160-1293(-)
MMMENERTAASAASAASVMESALAEDRTLEDVIDGVFASGEDEEASPRRRCGRMRTVFCPALARTGLALLAILPILGLGWGFMATLPPPNKGTTESGAQADKGPRAPSSDQDNNVQGSYSWGDSESFDQSSLGGGDSPKVGAGTTTSATTTATSTTTTTAKSQEDTIPERTYPTSYMLVSKGIAQISDFVDLDGYHSKALRVLTRNGVSSDYSDQKLAQRYALLCLYFSTYSVRTSVTDTRYGYGTTPKWHVLSPWKFMWKEDECAWYGIACDTDGLVLRIELANHLLTGHIPDELALLDGGPINELDFSGNPGLGDGGFPVVFTKFDSLAAIGLDGCSFEGNVPEEMCNSSTKIFIGCGLTCSCCEECVPEGKVRN